MAYTTLLSMGTKGNVEMFLISSYLFMCCYVYVKPSSGLAPAEKVGGACSASLSFKGKGAEIGHSEQVCKAMFPNVLF